MKTPINTFKNAWISSGHWILLGIAFCSVLATGYSLGLIGYKDAMVEIVKAHSAQDNERITKLEEEMQMLRDNIKEKNAYIYTMGEKLAALGITLGDTTKDSTQNVKSLTEKINTDASK